MRARANAWNLALASSLFLASCGAEETGGDEDVEVAVDAVDVAGSDLVGDDVRRPDAPATEDTPERVEHSVEELRPNHGSIDGQEQIGVLGRGFERDCEVFFGDNEALSVAFVNDRALDARTPAGDGPGAVDVIVVCGPNTATLDDSFTYEVEAKAEIDGFEPVFGRAAGGDLIVFSGRNIVAGARNLVRFGDDFGIDIEFVDEATLTAVTPEILAGPASVSVELGSARIDMEERFVFLDPLVVTDYEPFALDRAGGTRVTLRGSGLADFAGITVRFGDTFADPETYEFADDGLSLTLDAPTSESLGLIVVQVANLLEYTEIVDRFAYVDPITVTGIEPDAVPTLGVNRVTILGADFDDSVDLRAVRVGEEEAFDVSFDSDTAISFLSPPIEAGRYDVTLLHGFEVVVSPEPLDVFDPIELDELSTNRGPEAGGTRLDVTGSGFVDGMIVRFGAELGVDIAVNGSGTQLSITTPAVAPGTGTVSVTVQSPFSSATLEDAFTFEP